MKWIDLEGLKFHFIFLIRKYEKCIKLMRFKWYLYE